MQAASPTLAISPTQIQVTERPKEDGGWRKGRPVEDPEKTKRWGYVRAQPSEFLVHVRGGQVRSASSGQGATCWKWPWDSVSVVPTSLQQLRFRADQVTLEKVGIEVVGLAVYRIADPLVAYRVLNFSYPERAQEKLEETLTSMFVGAARRLIANLGLEDCLQKRKSSLAIELMQEVSPVVAGQGRLEDATQQGWGIVIDTIEIQEVRILSEAVFAQMQAPFRAALDRKARESRADANKEIATRDAACKQAIDEAVLQSAWVVAERKREMAAREIEYKRNEEIKRSRVERELAELKLVDEAAVKQKQAELELKARIAATERRMREDELRQQAAQAELATFAIIAEATEKRGELERAQLAIQVEKRRTQAEMSRLEGENAAAVAMENAHVEAKLAEARTQLRVAERLPDLANAIGSKIGEVKITQIGGEASNALGAVTGALQSFVDMTKKVH